jgi:uncharacterized membrane protein
MIIQTMTLKPLLNASLVIQLHVLAAILALVLGIFQFWMPKGGPHHGRGGVWLVAACVFCSFA